MDNRQPMQFVHAAGYAFLSGGISGILRDSISAVDAADPGFPTYMMPGRCGCRPPARHVLGYLVLPCSVWAPSRARQVEPAPHTEHAAPWFQRRCGTITVKKRMSSMRLSHSTLFAITSLILAACSAPVVSKSASPDASSGYVYGIFELPKPAHNCNFGAGFILKEIGSAKEHFLAFSQSEPMSVVPLSPGRYQIKQFVLKNCSGLEADRKDYAPPVMNGVIEVKPMTAVYIGNYAAQTYQGTSPGGLAKQNVFLSRLCRNFPVTTEKLRAGWPGLSPLQFVDATTGGPACIRPVS